MVAMVATGRTGCFATTNMKGMEWLHDLLTRTETHGEILSAVRELLPDRAAQVQS